MLPDCRIVLSGAARRQRTKSIPIIMLTARADEQDKLTGLDTGADDFATAVLAARIERPRQQCWPPCAADD
jgi:DNA-binding response OmpR family regulator